MTGAIAVAVVHVGNWWRIQAIMDGRYACYACRPYSIGSASVDARCLGWADAGPNGHGDQYVTAQAAINAARHDGFAVAYAGEAVP